MSNNIFLIGPMGVGKTTIGRHLARQLNREFVDSDQEIENRTGAAISLIFEIEGEEGFRRREAAVIEELSQGDGRVVATGGGAILQEANRRLMRSRGTVVYLSASLETQLKRTARNRNRPLLDNDDPRGTLESLMKVREPLYRQEADLTVSTDNRTPQAVAREIASQLENR